MKKRMVIMVLALLIVFGGIFGWKAFVNMKTAEFLANQKAPPVTVATMTAEKQTWQPSLRSTGSLRAVQGVDVTAEVPGKVARLAFDSGEQVEQGALLLSLDTSTEVAELQGLKAQRELSRQTLERKRRLRERNVGSQSDLDMAQAEYDNAGAAVQAKQAAINKKTINAPFAGVLGLRQVDLGEYLDPGATIVTLQTLDPIYLDFTLPQQQFDKAAVGQQVELLLEGLDGTFKGEVVAISPKVAAGTRSFDLRAQLDNPDGRLKPGMFGRVELLQNQTNEVITLPQTAIAYNPYGDTVFKVVEQTPEGGGEPEKRSKRVNVRTGETRGDQVQIVSGVDAGDEVVVAGQIKLRGGDRLIIDNEVLPENKAEVGQARNY